MRIFLMGMPGSGKSTAGKKLAKHLSLAFFDLDACIEARHNKKVSQLFSENGEDFFRKEERICLLELIASHTEAVISLGGGTPCFFDNAEVINANGISLYLEMPVAALINRLAGGAAERPLLKGLTVDEMSQKLEQLLKQRAPFYQKARYTISGMNLDVQQVADLLKLPE